MAYSSPKVESYMQIVFVISAASLLLPNITNLLEIPSGVNGGGISFSGCLQLLGFCTFEGCVVLFWPSMMKMRSQFIPEEARSTIVNFFPICLNIFVCIVLHNVDAFPITIMFGVCSIFLFMASVLQRQLIVVAESQKLSSVVAFAILLFSQFLRKSQVAVTLFVRIEVLDYFCCNDKTRF